MCHSLIYKIMFESEVREAHREIVWFIARILIDREMEQAHIRIHEYGSVGVIDQGRLPSRNTSMNRSGRDASS